MIPGKRETILDSNGVPRSVLLFDVDGTLVRTGGAGTRAIAATFGSLFGCPEIPGRIDVRGNTDGRIMRDALRLAGVECDEASMVERVLDVYLGHLADEVSRSPGYEVLPGVSTLLATLVDLPSLALGLGTGNVRRGASIKLARGGLSQHFAFGGFGCDSEHRPTLVRRGAERGAERLGCSLDDVRTVVIGDTPHDVSAARAMGASVIAVATGGHSFDELVTTGADLVVPTLEEPRVLAFLLGAAP